MILKETTAYKIYDNWRGNKKIKMVYFDNYSDPSLLYDGYEFNYYDVENGLWEWFEDDYYGQLDNLSENEIEDKFNDYVAKHAEGYMDDLIYSDYFEEGKKTWRKSA